MDQTKDRLFHIISAIFLVAGTCIGGGMLALPVATGVSGFLPSTTMMLLCWFAMTCSALFLLEVNLWMKEGSHMITMSSVILGPIGKMISWVVFLFISYASLVAYTAAGGSFMIDGIEAMTGMSMGKEWGCLIFILTFGGVIYLGSEIVGRVNTLLFVALILSYIALMSTGASEIKLSYLTHANWPTSYLAIPLLLTTFSFQTMLPSLTPYLKRNVRSLRWAIVGGTTLTLFVYMIWQWLILGIVPVDGPNSLISALEAGEPITRFFREHVESGSVSVIAEFFAFFALITSFLGIALGLYDFLSDGLKIKQQGWGKWFISFLIIIPIFIFSAYYDRVFLIALETTGGYGDSILNGIFPCLMVWIGRYTLHFPAENRTPGGKPLIVFVLLCFIASLTLEILTHTGVVCSMFETCQLMKK